MIGRRLGLFLSINQKIGKNVKIIDQYQSFQLLVKFLRDPFLVQSFFETLQYCDEWRKFTSVSQSVTQSVSQSVSQS